MARYRGMVGFATYRPAESDSDVMVEDYEERAYTGDFNRISRRLENNGQVNDDVTISNEISIVADPYATENFQQIRYATYMKSKWKVTNVQVQYPRLILTLGGLYHAEPEGSTRSSTRNC